MEYDISEFIFGQIYYLQKRKLSLTKENANIIANSADPNEMAYYDDLIWICSLQCLIIWLV